MYKLYAAEFSIYYVIKTQLNISITLFYMLEERS